MEVWVGIALLVLLGVSGLLLRWWEQEWSDGAIIRRYKIPRNGETRFSLLRSLVKIIKSGSTEASEALSLLEHSLSGARYTHPTHAEYEGDRRFFKAVAESLCTVGWEPAGALIIDYAVALGDVEIAVKAGAQVVRYLADDRLCEFDLIREALVRIGGQASLNLLSKWLRQSTVYATPAQDWTIQVACRHAWFTSRLNAERAGEIVVELIECSSRYNTGGYVGLSAMGAVPVLEYLLPPYQFDYSKIYFC
jgi:hypothetical protein